MTNAEGGASVSELSESSTQLLAVEPKGTPARRALPRGRPGLVRRAARESVPPPPVSPSEELAFLEASLLEAVRRHYQAERSGPPASDPLSPREGSPAPDPAHPPAEELDALAASLIRAVGSHLQERGGDLPPEASLEPGGNPGGSRAAVPELSALRAHLLRRYGTAEELLPAGDRRPRLGRTVPVAPGTPAAPRRGRFLPLLDALQNQCGSAPWWVFSSVLHGLVVLLLALMVIQTQAPPEEQQIPMSVASPHRDALQTERSPLTADLLTAEFSRTNLVAPPELVEVPFARVTEPPETVQPVNPATEPEPPEETPLPRDRQPGPPGVPAPAGIEVQRPGESAAAARKNGGEGLGLLSGLLPPLAPGAPLSGAALPQPMAVRAGTAKAAAIQQHGGSPETEQAVVLALRWLARVQDPDGHWSTKQREGAEVDIASTGLALLAFLGAGHTETTGEYADNVRRAVNWLIAQQGASGQIGTKQTFSYAYQHAIGAWAISEAYAMSRRSATGAAAQKALAYSVNVHQTPYSGWRYNAGRDADLSVTGWFVTQLRSAEIAGLQLPLVPSGKGFEGARRFLLSTAHRERSADGYPLATFSYQESRHGGGGPTTTAVGMFCHMLMGALQGDDLLVGGANAIAKARPDPAAPPNLYYLYYGTAANFNLGGTWWKEWNAALKATLLPRQEKSGDAAGSWNPQDTADAAQYGRVYSTALAVLCLEVYYRYLPLYKENPDTK